MSGYSWLHCRHPCLLVGEEPNFNRLFEAKFGHDILCEAGVALELDSNPLFLRRQIKLVVSRSDFFTVDLCDGPLRLDLYLQLSQVSV